MTPEPPEEQLVALLQCYNLELGADLNVWKPVFAFWITELVRWWNKQAAAMQKLVQEMANAVVLGGALAVAARKALAKLIAGIITRALAAAGVTAGQVEDLAGLAVSLLVAGVALGTLIDVVTTCWARQFPDDPLNRIS